jgi:hypothetical protein
VLRASVAAEVAGVPSVSLVCDGFEGQARATARGLGFDDLRLARLRGHVDAQSSDDMLASALAFTLPQVIDALTAPIAHDATTVGDPTGIAEIEYSALDIAASGTIEEINRSFVEHGWTDGSPIIPPTRDRVDAFIAPSGIDPWRVLGTARPSGRDVTVWSVAVNGVMAGCRADDLAVLLALAEVFVDPAYGVEHSGNTTGADALVVLNGPVIGELGFNHGQGALREGAAPNTTVGRWVRLFLRNVCGFTAHEHDKATFGNSARVVLAEDEAALGEIGWPSLASDFGAVAGADAVSVARINSGLIIGSVFGSTPDDIVAYLADGLVRVTGWDLTHVYGLGRAQYRPLLVLSPLLARVFARAGWSKYDLRAALFAEARVPAWKFEKLIGEWSNLTAGRRTLFELASSGLVPPEFAENDDPNRLVPIVTEPDMFLIAVAGDPNRANAYAMSNDGPHGQWTMKPIDRSYSSDLVCRIDRGDACK